MKRWLQSEIEWCALDKKPEGEDVDQSVYRARSLDQDFRRAEALASEAGVSIDDLQLIKVLLSRGHLEQAQEVLNHARQNTHQDGLDLWEIAFEQSRLAVFQGHWEHAVSVSSQVITSCPTGITVMGAYQVRALAHTEIGQFKKALEDVEKVISLGKLYPRAFSLFYAQVQKVRILFLEGQHSRAARLRSQLWEHFAAPFKNSRLKIDLDALLTLARLEIFSRQILSPQSAHTLLRIQWTTAEMMGDELYRSLSEAYGFLLGLTHAVTKTAKNFERVRFLLAGTSTESQQLHQLAQCFGTEVNIEKNDDLEPVRFVYLTASRKLLDLKSGRGGSVTARQDKLLALFKGEEPVNAEAAFQKVTGVSYRATVHKNYISNLVYQLNKKFPGALKIKEGNVVPDSLVVVAV